MAAATGCSFSAVVASVMASSPELLFREFKNDKWRLNLENTDMQKKIEVQLTIVGLGALIFKVIILNKYIKTISLNTFYILSGYLHTLSANLF